MTDLATDLMTFVFTDIEGSTTRWEHYPAAMKMALDQHHTLLRDAFATHGGTVIQTGGDGFVTAFARPDAALAASLAAQRALQAATWPAVIGPLRVRVALHSGPGEQRADGYHAEFTLNRLARLVAAGHGGQILVTATTRHLLDWTDPPVAWRDMGEHWLKDLIHPLHIYQALVPDLPHEFPPLQTLGVRPAPARPAVAAQPPPERPARPATAASSASGGLMGVGCAPVLPAPPQGDLLGSEHWLINTRLLVGEPTECWSLPPARTAVGGLAESWRAGI